MTNTADVTASGGRFVKATATNGTATYTVSVPTAGNYMIGGYVKAANTSSDAFNIKADNGSYQTWNLQSPTTVWTYDSTSNPVFSLSAGIHIITVQYREANASLDRLVLNKQ